MKHIILIAVLCLGFQASAMEFIPSESGDHCKDQIMNYFETKFGEVVEYSDWFSYSDGGSSKIYSLQTNLCQGTFYFRVPHSTNVCKAAHYAFVPQYIHSFYADGECSKIFPREVYIREGDLEKKRRP